MSVVAGPRLARIAALPTSSLDLSRAVTADLLAAVHETARIAALEANRAADALHDAVPRADGPTRRRLLSARRRLHRGTRLGQPDLELVAEWTTPGHRRALETAQDAHDAAADHLRTAVADDTRHAEGLLRAALAAPAVDDALSLVSPELRRSVGGADLVAGSRLARKALFAVARAALKPTPLSTLAGIRHESDAGPARRVVQISPTLVPTLLAAAAADPAVRRTLVWRRSGETDRGEGRRVIRRRVSIVGGFGWGTTSMSTVDDSSSEVSDAPCHPLTWDDLRRLAAGAADPDARVGRWVASGLVEPVVPLGPDGGRLADLAAVLAASGTPVGVDAAGHLERALEHADEVAALSGDDRRSALGSLNHHLAAAADALDADLDPRRVVYEDSVSPHVRVPPDDGRALQAVADHLRPTFFRSRAYGAVVEAFTARHGIGGRAVDAALFFHEAAGDPTWAAEVHRRWTADSTHAADPADAHARGPVGRTTAPPTAAVSYQEATTGGDALVLNQVHGGLGGIIARYGQLDGEDRGPVRTAVDAWLDSCFGDVPWLPFVPNHDVNSLQRQGAGGREVLHWPADGVPRRAGATSFSDLSLTHDAASDTLEFRTARGDLVAPVYLGVVPPWSFDLATRLALTVMDPWVDGSELSRASNPYVRRMLVASRPGHRDRCTVDGAVVVERETWDLPGDTFPTADRPLVDAVAYLLEVDGWRRGHGMPDEVFVVAIGSDPVDASTRKPVWLDFRSLHAVLAVAEHVAGAELLRVQEASPTRAAADRVVEHLRLLRWQEDAR
ncbi:hypothetical protein ACPEEZ_12965 [Frigoribacterium sp. 2-23]|uniref:hypothetical protein n=1 Tax=Frigoribacterium sp. 2-23 TaxID=3415006 RepID=UPI003C703E78